MSRSRRKTPIVGVTSAASDKRFKKAEHGRERAAVRVTIDQGEEPPAAKQFGDPWKGEKDGKLYRPDDPRHLRK